MTDQRFKYYTGYEVDNEPSDDEDDLPCNTAITNGHASSDSSDNEFDRPIRDYIEKTMSEQSNQNRKSISTTSNTFANEMEDELDQIYHNFISRGTFELPISTQKPQEKKVALKEQDEDDSDDEPDQPELSKEDQDKANDDLLYDPDEEEEDEKWMTKERLKSRGAHTTEKLDSSALGPTDAVLNCPGCMILVCHDCQRHDTNRNQYRAMFVFNCTIDQNRVASVFTSNSQKSAKQKKKNNKNKRFKTDDQNSIDNEETEHENQDEILRPLLCSECGTELGAYEPKEELYHFANVLASH
ncbi:unnamed protein product [Adineta steineri]|uniref:E2F-associated phosphoprotein n=1 Tax=Adineta steineri TaxID=433720 RepID=A0A814FG48_9BILA|nr:unnamed protein product [Adineta steineri]